MGDTQERSRQIGAALRRARLSARKTIKECAAHIGTSWRRYDAIERGTVYVAAVELEELVRYMEIAPHEVWPEDLIYAGTRRVVLDIQPGERVQVVVERSAVDLPATEAPEQTLS